MESKRISSKGLRNSVKPWKKDFARKLRRNPTASEKLLFKELRSKRLGVKFRRQVVLFGWIVDFYCPSKKLAVELDGKFHNDKIHKDRKRDEILAEHGIRTLRIYSSRVFNDKRSVVQEILIALK